MTSLRSRLLAALLFGLLSLGQAYPFAAASAASTGVHACCCLKGEEGKTCRCRHGGKMSCHRETAPGYSAAPCGTPKDVHSFNFSGDPCLPRWVAPVLATFEELRRNDLPARFTEISSGPESPPPKSRNAS